MITMDVIVAQVPGLQRRDLERWVANAWVRHDREDGEPVFHEIDVARVRLIRQLFDDMQVNEEALPIVLSLLDQLYEQRRRLRELSDALAAVVPDEWRLALARHLGGRPDP